MTSTIATNRTEPIHSQICGLLTSQGEAQRAPANRNPSTIRIAAENRPPNSGQSTSTGATIMIWPLNMAPIARHIPAQNQSSIDARNIAAR